MIIFGTRRSERPIESGRFHCPLCDATRAYRRTQGRSWFTLYFVPVFPISGKRDQAECQGCFGRFDGHSVEAGLGGSARFAEPLHATTATGDARDPLSDPDAPAKIASPNVLSPAAIPQVSSLAVASLVTAVLSPFLILACGVSLVSSIAAIVTGHMAVAAITRSGGLLRGTGMARCGLAGGYLFAVLSVAFVPGGTQLVTGGRGQVTLWDLENATPLQRFNLGGVSYIQTLAVSPDGTQLAAVPSAAGQTLSVFRLGPEG